MNKCNKIFYDMMESLRPIPKRLSVECLDNNLAEALAAQHGQCYIKPGSSTNVN